MLADGPDSTFYAFGPGPHPRIGAGVAPDGPLADRLRAIWAFLADRARRIAERCPEAGDAEEILQRAAAALVERDHLYDPGRARYTTFAKVILRGVVARAVEDGAPVRVNDKARRQRRDLEALAAAGHLPAGRQGRLEQLRRAMAPAGPLPDAADGRVPAGEDSHSAADLLRRIDPHLAFVLGRSHGCFGGRPWPDRRLARALGVSPEAVPGLRAEALRRCRRLGD